ncbi:hypothetical protein SAMD00019534_016500 [Acytostelium subglobosum LB1]|uniref:hypothetical protein n=1 Tax=Acytostelium subglobosum LB1 TaxID=1410327 RepID=UPI000644F39C|nr:hypothetical protein SAMD00019534_016500 [Acytostelium subglobosum LB1]GAM18475.1 hypothetical protein SAMD00019534_016500 [Acytostelium subglobosum LB1]|eukprot:XP_012757695.1 hypothetical protein SAMD00019534_016500 [Acytostelium subglobosum LB1]
MQQQQPQQDPLDAYTLIRDLRSGGEGKAILMERDGVKYVCKQRIFESVTDANVGLKEAYSMAGIKDDNIVKFEEVFLRTIPGDNHIYLCIIVEYCPKGDLLDFLHELVSLNYDSSTTSSTGSLVSDFSASSLSTTQGDATQTSLASITSGASSGSFYHTNSNGPATGNVNGNVNGNGENNNLHPLRPHQSLSDGSQNFISSDKLLYVSIAERPTTVSTTSLRGMPEVVTEERKCIIAHAKELVKKIIDKEALYLSIHPPSSPSKVANNSGNSSGNSGNSKKTTSSSNTTTIGTTTHSMSELTSGASSTSLMSLGSESSGTFQRGQVLIQRDILLDWLIQLCLGVHALHKERLIHRDLKCENIFISMDDKLKIGDFGLATKNTGGHGGRVGTYIYSAPEVLENQAYDRSADIFSLGCIFYELITLKLLVTHRRYFAEEIIEQRFDKMSFLADFPEKFTRLGPIVLKMLDRNPSLRPSIETIIAQIKGDYDIGQDLRLRLKKENSFPGIRRQLSKNDHKEFAALFARAFKNDPRYVALFPPEEPNSHKLLLELMLFTARCFHKQNSTFWGYFGKDGKMKSACVWFSPDNKKEIRLGDIFVGGMKFVSKAGILRSRKGMKMMGAIKDIVMANDEEKHWALAYIGTDDDCRNSGLGTYLLEPVLEWADHSGYQCKTFTFEKKSMPFLQRMGFELTKEIVGACGLPKSIEAVHVLVRQPVKRNNN